MDEQEVLAILRTLLAYERSYQSIERTQLAQLRTGITLALIIPAATATLAYVFEVLPKDYYLSIIVYLFLAIIILYGIWMATHAYFSLKTTRKLQSRIRERQLEIIRQSEYAKSLVGDIFPHQD
jgi:hypothetical protein